MSLDNDAMHYLNQIAREAEKKAAKKKEATRAKIATNNSLHPNTEKEIQEVSKQLKDYYNSIKDIRSDKENSYYQTNTNDIYQFIKNTFGEEWNQRALIEKMELTREIDKIIQEATDLYDHYRNKPQSMYEFFDDMRGKLFDVKKFFSGGKSNTNSQQTRI